MKNIKKEQEKNMQVNSLGDPTYDKEKINTDPIWKLAFLLSEIEDDKALLGWARYITTARCLLDKCDIKYKGDK